VLNKALIDTNILLSLIHPRSGDALIILDEILARYEPCICFQNIAEFWVVATRPTAVNGLALNSDEVSERISWFRQIFTFVPETPPVMDTWLALCQEFKIVGKRAHDIRLAALAVANGISTVLTNNPSDFVELKNLNIVNPLSELR
jgi:predicted nucleic acid-binding protein